MKIRKYIFQGILHQEDCEIWVASIWILLAESLFLYMASTGNFFHSALYIHMHSCSYTVHFCVRNSGGQETGRRNTVCENIGYV